MTVEIVAGYLIIGLINIKMFLNFEQIETPHHNIEKDIQLYILFFLIILLSFISGPFGLPVVCILTFVAGHNLQLYPFEVEYNMSTNDAKEKLTNITSKWCLLGKKKPYVFSDYPNRVYFTNIEDAVLFKMML